MEPTPQPTFAFLGVVDGEDLRITGIEDAYRAITVYREIVGSGKVGALAIFYGDEQISYEQLRRLAGKR
jgi:hypothetical protein